MSNRPLSTSDGFAHAGPNERGDGSLDSGADDQRLSRLSRLIEGEIIPRLLICHTATRRPSSFARIHSHPTSEDVAELARLMLQSDRGLADAYLESIHLRGASRVLICAELLAPTAKHLGQLWERDECDFDQLTNGLRRLESVLDEFRDR